MTDIKDLERRIKRAVRAAMRAERKREDDSIDSDICVKAWERVFDLVDVAKRPVGGRDHRTAFRAAVDEYYAAIREDETRVRAEDE